MSTSTRIAAGRPWTAEEDAQLRAAVALHGENDNWKTVAEMVPGRTNKACRKRWRHSLSPGVKKSAWTPEEDKLLLELHEKHGDKWSVIAREIEGRTDDACSKRYREALDPHLRKDEWTDEDDKRLRDLHAQLSGQWRLIGAALCRGSLACRNRWRLFERKQRRLAQLSKYDIPDFGSSIAPSSEASYENAWMQSVVSPPVPPGCNTCDPLVAYHPEQADPFPVQSSSFDNPWSWYHSDGSIQSADAQTSAAGSSVDHLDPRASSEGLRNISVDSSCFTGGTCTESPSHVTHWTLPHPGASSAAGAHALPPVPSEAMDAVPFHAAFPSIAPYSSPEGSREVALPILLPERSPTFSANSLLASPSSPHGTALPDLSPQSTCSVELPACDTLWNSPTTDPCPLTPLLPTPQTTQADLPHVQVVGEHEEGRVMQAGLLPYVCGRATCWPISSPLSTSRYDTARELGEHMRRSHAAEAPGDVEKPYRCGLNGCGKAWKNLNGLQYHLQVAEAHYKKALMSKAKVESLEAPAPSESDNHKTYRCPEPDCCKVYSHASGLRYHRLHVHKRPLPEQLSVLPPSVEKKVPRKARTYRRPTARPMETDA
ncbi:hypothetical protein HDZ31DRAFT_85949 [Schizophyllum fasciatum]